MISFFYIILYYTLLYFTILYFALSAYFLKGFRFLFYFRFYFYCFSIQDFPFNNNKVKNNQCFFKNTTNENRFQTCIIIVLSFKIHIFYTFLHQHIIPTHCAYLQNWFLQSNESLWHHLWILNSLAMIFLLKTNMRKGGYDFPIKSFCTLVVFVFLIQIYIKRKGSIVWWIFRMSFKLAIIFNVHHTSKIFCCWLQQQQQYHLI